jgi:hypothetical protein
MSVKDRFDVEKCYGKQIHSWLKNQHYAECVPSITWAFRLYDNEQSEYVGAMSVGVPPNLNFNDGECVFDDYEVTTKELNRLITNDGLPKNTLSYFVSHAVDLLPEPMCLVSYADEAHGHHGYVYQATNWIYTGTTSPRTFFVDQQTGKEYHRRSLNSIYGTSKPEELPDHFEKRQDDFVKHRYFYFHGDKKQKRKMESEFTYDEKPYPKGENETYDVSHTTEADKFLDKVGNDD